MDIGQSLNSRDSFPERKFKNRAPTSCSPGPVLSPPTITFELHAKTAEDIDLEKCTFRNFGSSVTLTLDRVEVTLVCISGQGLTTHQITWKSVKTFCGRTEGRTDTPEFQSTRSSLRRWPKKKKKKPQGKNIMSASAMQGGCNRWCQKRHLNNQTVHNV